MIPQTLHLNKLPPSQPEPPTPAATQPPEPQAPEPQTEQPTHETEDELLKELWSERGYSADTVINEETQLPEVIPQEPAHTEKPPLSEKEAWDNTETLFNLRETVQSYGLAYYVDGSFKAASQYDYEPEEKQRLIRAWSRVIGHYRVKVSPWIDVLMTEAVCTGPLVVLAYNNRMQRIELEQQRAEISRLQRDLANAKASPAASTRRDTKTQWKIDESGYFEYTAANTYITKGNRREKPELTPENYDLLCKHNGKEFVDRAFNIS